MVGLRSLHGRRRRRRRIWKYVCIYIYISNKYIYIDRNHGKLRSARGKQKSQRQLQFAGLFI